MQKCDPIPCSNPSESGSMMDSRTTYLPFCPKKFQRNLKGMKFIIKCKVVLMAYLSYQTHQLIYRIFKRSQINDQSLETAYQF